VDKPVMPDHEGRYKCQCDDEFKDIFDFLGHNGVQYEWGVRLTRNYSFDLFEFLSALNNFMISNKYQDAYECIQSAALTFMNAGEGLLSEFMEEVMIYSEADEMFDGLEKMLKEEGKKNDK
jgi:hypothetical protein